MAQSLSQHTIANIAKSDPLIITGAIGTQNTFYHSSLGSGYRSPWANSIYANLNVSLYGVSMPFSFYYSNNNSSFNFLICRSISIRFIRTGEDISDGRIWR